MGNVEKYYNYLFNELKKETYLSTKRNNKLVYEYLKAKENGGYGRLLFEKNADNKKTINKKFSNIRKIDEFFKKDFDTLSEQDIINFRDSLNNNQITKNQTLIKWEKDNEGKLKSSIKVEKTNTPITYRTKTDYRTNFMEFWKFITEYVYQESGKELKDITKYFKLKRPQDFQQIKVDFIPDEQLPILFENIHNIPFKRMLQLTLMSGARPCEIIEVRYKTNLYKKDGKWIIKLPKIKGVSFQKYAVPVDMYEEELYSFFDNLKLDEGDKVFNISEFTFRKLMLHYTENYLNKRYSPKILRKTARMIRTNAGYSHDWINKLMGHSPNSKVQAHYVNYDGIKQEELANDKLKNQQSPTFKADLENMKLKNQALSHQLKEQANELESIRLQMKEMFKQMAINGQIKMK